MMARVLMAPSGARIAGTEERLTAVALALWHDGRWMHEGSTDVDWDSQNTVTCIETGEPVFQDDDGNWWRESQLRVMDDGAEESAPLVGHEIAGAAGNGDDAEPWNGIRVSGGFALVPTQEYQEMVARANRPMRVAVTIEGGVVSGVCCDRAPGAEVYVVDYDTTGCDDSEVIEIGGGRAIVRSHGSTVDPIWVQEVVAAEIERLRGAPESRIRREVGA